MANVKIIETPTQQILAKANEEFVIADESGRKITLKKPGVLSQYRLVEALGDSAKNETYMNMVLPILYVSAIDGDAINAPSNKMQIEALIQRLDENGLNALMKGIQDNFGNVRSMEAEKDKIKK